MWRHSCKTSVVCRAVRNIKNARRSYAEEATPTPPPVKKSGGGTLFKLLGLTTVGAGGAVGYAWYDKSFRRTIEESVPYSKEALAYIFSVLPLDSLGGGRETPVDMPSFPSKVPAIPGSRKTEVVPTTDSRKPVIDKIPSPKAEQGIKKELSVEAPALLSKQELERQIAAQEAAAEVDNVALEQIARELITSCEKSAQVASQRHLEAVQAINMHKEQVKKAMKAGAQGENWKSVSNALDQKKELVEEADKCATEAKNELQKLSHLLTDGRENPNTKANPILIRCQSRLNQLSYRLDQAKTERRSVESSLTMLSEFRDLIDRGRKQFQKELDSIVPDASVGKKGKLTEDELNALIAHAHRRIEQLQVRLAEQEALEQERLNQALVKQRSEDEQLTKNVVEQELERERGEESLLRQKWEAGVMSEMEERLRQELSRQAAAHNDHLADVLRVQRRELSLQYQDDLREVILQERVMFNNEIGSSMARLRGIEAAVEARAQIERTGRKAQELWLSCQTLVRSLNGDANQSPLGGDVRAVQEAGNGHVFVDALVASIPAEAIDVGVQPETVLAERFRKVKKVCRRVSMIDETGGSLVKYLVSYVQSLFILDRAKAIGLNDNVKLEDLDTFTILSEAERYLNEGDLEQAVRFVRQLTGQPRLVAEDWLKDAILLLETRQAANALLGHASACGLGSLCSAFAKEEKHCCH